VELVEVIGVVVLEVLAEPQTEQLPDEVVECGDFARIPIRGLEELENGYSSVKPEVGEARKFLEFSKLENAFLVASGATNASDVGLYNISVSVVDAESNRLTYEFALNVTCEVPAEESDAGAAFPGVVVLAEYKQDPVKSLNARIKKFTQNGLLHIAFDRPVNPITNYTLIEEGEVLFNGQVLPILEIKMVPSEFQSIENLSFNWTVSNFTENELILQIIFLNPKHVSIYSESDGLELTINGYHLFVDKEGTSIAP